MKITIEGNAKEIAGLIIELQGRRGNEEFSTINANDLLGHKVTIDYSSLLSPRPENQLQKEDH